MPIGMPSRMRLSAPTDGFIWLDSIREIVELVTPARFASSRCDSLWRARMNLSRPPMSTLMSGVRGEVLQVLRIAQIWTGSPSKINGLQVARKGLVAPWKPWLCYEISIGAARDPSSDSEHHQDRLVLDAVH